MSEIAETDEGRTDCEERYVSMFGILPPLPGKPISYLSKASPELLARGETARINAFANNAFGDKTTQLILTALLAAQTSPVMKWHIKAARRAGASDEEIFDAIELASAVSSLGVLNTAYAVMHDLGDDDSNGDMNRAGFAGGSNS